MYCVDRSIFYFGARVSEIYAAKYHGEQTKVASESLIEDLRSSFSTLINEAQWMDEGISGMPGYIYRNRVKNDRTNFEIPALLSSE